MRTHVSHVTLSHAFFVVLFQLPVFYWRWWSAWNSQVVPSKHGWIWR